LAVNVAGGLLALGWAALALDYALGARRAKRLDEVPPFGPDENAPPLSVVFAACNEQEKLPRALDSLRTQNYPGSLEIVGVDDRSTDATGTLLDRFAQSPLAPNKSAVALHVRHLPSGWLGKTHALWQGAHASRGEWILFTDADIVFAPDALSRAVALAERDKLDHLVSFFRLDLRGFWEHTFGLCFGFLFFIRFRPWHVRNPKMPNYLGVGGFNLVRRSAYQAIGTHRASALQVADDMELGRRIKQAGLASEVIGAADQITVRWQEGLSGLMGGLVKNAYAGLSYSPATLLGSAALLFAGMTLPLIGLFVADRGLGTSRLRRLARPYRPARRTPRACQPHPARLRAHAAPSPRCC
jgi:cellulose synthase/poly-beta-1,6-N-acetylglucosamine synthase-like glycosyltransferase